MVWPMSQGVLDERQSGRESIVGETSQTSGHKWLRYTKARLLVSSTQTIWVSPDLNSEGHGMSGILRKNVQRRAERLH